MDARETRGRELATTKELRRKGEFWVVPSQRGSGSYLVDFSGNACSCPDFETRGGPCKHLWSVQFTLQRETRMSDGTTVTETVSVRRSYRQDTRAYNLAQTTEKRRVVELLHNLCSAIPSPERKRGRPRLPLADVILASAVKVYGTVSGRRSACDIEDLAAKGFIRKAPHYNSIFNYLENPALTPVLMALIYESANPFSGVEVDFATDATGFSTSSKDNYFEAKHEGAKQRRKFVKCHLTTGVVTHVVTAVEVTEGNEADSPYLPGLVETTARRFQMREVSADKGYLSNENLISIFATGATPFIPFKINSRADGNSQAWRQMYHHFSIRREDFLAHYHKRSNVETVFSMIKAKFGAGVRSKTYVAQKNEVLLKVLLHNLCVLVQAMYELGIDPVFWPKATDEVAGIAS